VHEAVPDLGLVVNVSEADPRLRPLPLEVLASYGVRIALYPVAPLLAAAAAARATYAAIATEGSALSVDRLAWDELTGLVGQPELLELESRYGDGAP
jgi:2-methylisocitrate lyase-like PEP mutase family enzyme